MKPLSHKARLALWCVGLQTPLLAALGFAAYVVATGALRDGVDSKLRSDAEALAAFCEWDETRGVPEFANAGDPGGATFGFGRGFEILRYPTLEPVHRGGSVPADARDAVYGREGRFSDVPGDPPLRVFAVVADVEAVPATEEDPAKPGFAVIVRAAEPLDVVVAHAARIGGWLAVLVALAALAAAAIAWALSRRYARPLAALHGAATEVREGRRARLPDRGSDDEVDRLAAALQSALDGREEALRRQARFTADAAHELRNPVAAVRSSAEVALRRDRSPDEYRRFLRDVLETSERMGAAIEGLLTLARLDADALRTEFAPVDLAALVREAASERPDAVDLDVDAPGPADLRGDPRLLRILFDNLVVNARRHAAGSRIEVRVGADAAGVALRVRDFGPGVPEAARRDVFRRFFRAESADRSAPRAPGVGLGLAIVAEIAQLHGAQCDVEDARPGALFSVRFGGAASASP